MAAGVFGLSVDPQIYEGTFLQDLFFGTFYHQHLGEAFSGLSTLDGQKINIRTHVGLFRPNFEYNLGGLDGTEGIGYCGSSREPFRTRLRGRSISLCFRGNIINRPKLISQLGDSGHLLERGDDIEIIATLIAQGKTIIDGIKIMNDKIEGAYVLLILTLEGIYAIVSPDSHWPLVVGKKEGAVVVASEPGGFDNIGFKLLRDIEPGQIAFVKGGDFGMKGLLSPATIQICSFLWVYTTFPNAVIRGIPASLVRKRLGASLARRDIEQGFIPHIVCPVPDSGRSHAIGYHSEFLRQMMLGKIKRVPFYDELLLRYSYAGRSFPRGTQEKRDQEAHIKILRSGESLDDLLEFFHDLADFLGISLEELIVALCEDSVVRGTQIRQNLAPKLRSIGVGQIHVRASNPELLSHCPWGKTTKEGETLAERLPRVEDRIRELGVDSLEYNTIEDLVEAIGLPREQLCVDCSLKRN